MTSILKKPRFHVSIQALPHGGGYSTTRHSITACVTEGLNHSRFLLAPIAGRTHTHCRVRVEVLCATCEGSGRAGKRACPDCKGGKVTSPISGPTAITFTVAAGGAVYEGEGPIEHPCGCGDLREGSPGNVCQRCARAIGEVAP